MTRDEAREVLLRGGCIHYHAWTWTKTYVVCGEGCCDCDFTDVEETLDNIENCAEWEEIRID